VDQVLLMSQALRSHTDIPRSVVVLRTSDDLGAEISNLQNTTAKTDRHPCPRQDSNSQSQQASWRKLTT